MASKVKPRFQATPALKVGMVAVDCVLVALAPIFIQLSKDSTGAYSYSPIAANLLIELVKTVFAFAVLVVAGTDRPGVPMTRSLRSFVRDASHCRLLFIPASLYALNNYLKFVMQLFFSPTSAKMIGNLKVFAIALLMRSVMGRRFSVLKWEALFLLVAGISINQLSNCEHGQPVQLSATAACVVLGTVTVPSLASVYNEYGFKKDMETSVHVQNFFLYLFGFITNAAGMGLSTALGSVPAPSQAKPHSAPPASPFTGLVGWVLVLVVINAAQGVLASFFYKFADTILKKYSSTLATIFTGVLSAVLFGHSITVNFVIGISIVLVSMHQFFTDPERQPEGTSRQAKVHVSPSMEHMLDAVPVTLSGGNLTERSSSLLPR